MAATPVDFYFFIGSTYTYLTVMRIEQLAAEADAAVRWRPINLRRIMMAQNNVPFRDKPVKSAYMWRDLERRARRHGIAHAGTPPYPVDAELLANRVGAVAAAEGWCADYTRSIYRRWFLDHEAPGDPAGLRQVLGELRQDAEAVLGRAQSGEGEELLESATRDAEHLGVFGSPTFAVGGEIFWGDDRLEEALEWAAG